MKLYNWYACTNVKDYFIQILVIMIYKSVDKLFFFSISESWLRCHVRWLHPSWRVLLREFFSFMWNSRQWLPHNLNLEGLFLDIRTKFRNTAYKMYPDCYWSFIRLNSLRPSDAYMRQYSIATLVQIMACHLFRDKPSSEQMLPYC